MHGFIRILTKTCIQEQGGTGQPKIIKSQIRKQFVSVKNWILENKMNVRNSVSRNEFRTTFGAWLKEYSE